MDPYYDDSLDRLPHEDPAICAGCEDRGWLDIHDGVGCEGDLPVAWELIGGRIHAACTDCNDYGDNVTPF